MEVSGSHRSKVIWEVADNNVVEDPKNNDEVGLRWLYLNFLVKAKTRGGGGDREGLSEYTYL